MKTWGTHKARVLSYRKQHSKKLSFMTFLESKYYQVRYSFYFLGRFTESINKSKNKVKKSIFPKGISFKSTTNIEESEITI